MLSFAFGLLNLVWKILVILFVFAVLKALLKNGGTAIKDMIDTAAMGVKVLTARLQAWLFTKYKEGGR